MKIIVQFSGGKDSQASLILAVKKYGAKNVTAVFMDTKWEKPTLYIHTKKFCDEIGVELVELTSQKYDGMIGLAEKKGRFPSSKARFCTEELKVKPFIDYILDVVKDNVLIFQGIRAQESPKRSRMNEQCTFFKYYFVPHTNNFIKLQNVQQIIHEKRRKHHKVPINKLNEEKKLKEKLRNGEIENKYYTYRKKDVIKFNKEFAHDLHRNVFHMTAQEVINVIVSEGYEPFESYFEGSTRVGCYPCMNEDLFSIYQISIRDPQRIEEIRKEEIRLGTTFFTTGKIPKRECANGQYPTIYEVVAYVKKLYGQNKLFPSKNNEAGCISHYMLCKN